MLDFTERDTIDAVFICYLILLSVTSNVAKKAGIEIYY